MKLRAMSFLLPRLIPSSARWPSFASDIFSRDPDGAAGEATRGPGSNARLLPRICRSSERIQPGAGRSLLARLQSQVAGEMSGSTEASVSQTVVGALERPPVGTGLPRGGVPGPEALPVPPGAPAGGCSTELGCGGAVPGFPTFPTPRRTDPPDAPHLPGVPPVDPPTVLQYRTPPTFPP